MLTVINEKTQYLIGYRLAQGLHWIGLSSHKDGIYRWSDGSESTYDNWAANELDRFGRPANCTFIQGGQWHVLNCGEKLPSMCQILRRKHYI